MKPRISMFVSANSLDSLDQTRNTGASTQYLCRLEGRGGQSVACTAATSVMAEWVSR